MMGHRSKLRGGFEWDALGKCRRMHCYLLNAGVARKAKRQHNKRVRRAYKAWLYKDLL